MGSQREVLDQIREAVRGEARGVYTSEFLTLGGSGVTAHMVGGSSGVTELFLSTARNYPFVVTRMIIQVEDGAGFDASDYGSIAGGLANGLRLFVLDENGAVQTEMTDANHTIKQNVDWPGYCYDARLDTYGAGNSTLSARWTFGRAGRPLILPANWQVAVMGQDDFSGLVDHHFLIQGYEIP